MVPDTHRAAETSQRTQLSVWTGCCDKLPEATKYNCIWLIVSSCIPVCDMGTKKLKFTPLENVYERDGLP